MNKFILTVFIAFITTISAHAEATLPGDYYVTSSSLNVRLAPNIKGKITNVLYKRQKVEVFEVKDGWARISDYYAGKYEHSSGEVAIG